MNFVVRPFVRLHASPTIFKSLSVSLKRTKLLVAKYCQQSEPKSLGHKNISPRALPNEVVLYENTNSSFINRIRFLSVAQYVIWTYLGYFGYKMVDEDAGLDEQNRLSEEHRKLMKFAFLGSVFLGSILLTVIWCYVLRTVKKITLAKNGRLVVLQTYGPILGERTLLLPLERVSAVKSRYNAKGYFPLKVRGKWFYFLVDMEGNFKNISLFDSTIAVKRNLQRK